jgi:hypothetical protein
MNSSSNISYASALGAELSAEDIRQRLATGPAWSPEVRTLPHADRLTGVRSLSEFYFPVWRQRRLAEDLQAVLRNGYANRSFNPDTVKSTVMKQTSNRIKSCYEAKDVERSVDNTQLSGALLGLPWCGKSATVRRTIKMLDNHYRRIVHVHQKVSPRILTLVIDCPVDSTLKAFCLAFMDALEAAHAGAKIRAIFGHAEALVAGLPNEVVRLAKNYAIGLLVVDDIQNLGGSAESQKVLQLLMSLSSNAGVPVLAVGTNAAAATICASFKAGLWSSGDASAVWPKLSSGRDWDDFIEALWPYQWTRTQTPLSDELSKILYLESQGVIGLAVLMYQRIQSLLIQKSRQFSDTPLTPENAAVKGELITPEVIRSVAAHYFQTVAPMLDALRTNDPAILNGYPDLRPLTIEALRMKTASEGTDNQSAEATTSDDTEQGNIEDEGVTSKTEKDAEPKPVFTRDQIREYGRQALIAEIADQKRVADYLRDIEDILKKKEHENPRRFFREIEKRINAARRQYRKLDDPNEKWNPGGLNSDDLRKVLKPGLDPLMALRDAGIDGTAGFDLSHP